MIINTNDDVGSLNVITFRADRREHPYFESIMSLLRGTSSGHIAIKLQFYNEQLFKKYIENNSAIHYNIQTDPKTSRKIFEIYVSFWPKGNWVPWGDFGIMKPYKFDCEQSGNYCPVSYNQKFADYLQPLQKYTKSSLPFFNQLPCSVISLPPTIILHSTRLGMAYGDKQAMIPNQDIIKAAESYTKKYHAWRVSLIAEQNAKIRFNGTAENLAGLARQTTLARIRMSASQKNLKGLISPNEALNDDQFYKKLENFITFGHPERDSITLPLTSSNSDKPGLELEPILAFIKKLANHPELFPYNVFSTNCARLILDLLWQGCKNSSFKTLHREFILPWFIRWFNITITPALIIRYAHRIQNNIIALTTKALDTTNAATDSIEPPVVTTKLKGHNYSQDYTPKTLEFYSGNSSEDDELPTSRSGMFAKIIENVTQNVR